MKNITLQKIEITNFRGYFGGPHIFSFDDDASSDSLDESASRVFHIQGISGRGKTTLLRAILHAFFGIHNPLPNQLKTRATSSSTKSKSRLEMKKAKGMSCGHVRLFFYSAVLQAQCIIDRKSNPSILKISVNGKEYSGDVQRLITEEILCLTETQFSLSSYLVQGKHNSLLSLSSSEKFRFIEEILYDEESSPSKLKEKILELKNETLLKVAEIEHEHEVQTRLLKNFKAKKESLSENLSPEAISSSTLSTDGERGDTSTTEIDEKITNLNSKLKKIRNSMTSTKAKLAEFSKLENALSKIDITYAEKVDFLSEIQSLEEEGKEVNDLVKLIRKYELRISKAQSSINEIEELLEETAGDTDVGVAPLEISREVYFLILFERVVCTLFYSFRKRAPKDVMLTPEGKMSPPTCISKTDLPSLKELKKFRDSLIGALTTSVGDTCNERASVKSAYDLVLEFLHSLPSSIRKSIGEDTSLARESVYAPLFSINEYDTIKNNTTTPSCTYELNEGVFNGEIEIQCRWCNGTIIVNSNEPTSTPSGAGDGDGAINNNPDDFPESDVFFQTLFEKFEEVFSLDSLREARFSPLETKASFKHFDVKELVSQIDFSRVTDEQNSTRTMSNLLKTRYEKAKLKLEKVTREFEEDERLSDSSVESLEKRGSQIRKSISDLEKRKTLHEVYLSKVENISLRAEEIKVEFDSDSLSFSEKANEKFENELSIFREKGEKVGKKIETLREIKANLALISHLSEIQKSIDNSTTSLETLSSQLTSLREKLYSQEILLEVLKKSKMESIESTLSALNSLAAKFIPLFFKVSGKSVKVALSSSTTTSRGEVRNKISVSVVSEGVTFDSYTDLSEGERQRIEFAYILAVNMYLGSPFLIIDECLNGVDQFTKQDILETLNSYSKENDVDVFITGHELNNAVIDTIIEL